MVYNQMIKISWCLKIVSIWLLAEVGNQVFL